jgi:hypothetical protein
MNVRITVMIKIMINVRITMNASDPWTLRSGSETVRLSTDDDCEKPVPKKRSSNWSCVIV